MTNIRQQRPLYERLYFQHRQPVGIHTSLHVEGGEQRAPEFADIQLIGHVLHRTEVPRRFTRLLVSPQRQARAGCFTRRQRGYSMAPVVLYPLFQLCPAPVP